MIAERNTKTTNFAAKLHSKQTDITCGVRDKKKLVSILNSELRSRTMSAFEFQTRTQIPFFQATYPLRTGRIGAKKQLNSGEALMRQNKGYFFSFKYSDEIEDSRSAPYKITDLHTALKKFCQRSSLH